MFRRFAVLTAFFAFSSAHATLECKGSKAVYNSDGARVTAKNLDVMWDDANYFLAQVEFEGRAFSVTADKKLMEAKLTISKQPDYMDGIISSSSFNTDRPITISDVQGENVFRIECLVKKAQ